MSLKTGIRYFDVYLWDQAKVNLLGKHIPIFHHNQFRFRGHLILLSVTKALEVENIHDYDFPSIPV